MNMSRSKTLLEVVGVSVHYGGVRALEPTSFSVEDHSQTVILGPNGAGKTSLLRALAGAVPVRTGRVMLRGENITSAAAFKRVKRGIALVPEGRGRLPTLTVRDNLILGWESAAVARREPYERELSRIFDL